MGINFNPSQNRRKPFKVRKTRTGGRLKPDVTYSQPRPMAVEVASTRIVKGKRATDIEANAAAAAEKHPEILRYDFREVYIAGQFLPGRLEVDFVFYTAGGIYPWFADGNYWHKTVEQKEQDKQRVAELDAELAGRAFPAQRVPGDPYLLSIDAAYNTIDLILQGFFLSADL